MGRNTGPPPVEPPATTEQVVAGTGSMEPISQLQSVTSKTPTPMIEDDASQTDKHHRKMRRGEGEIPVPTSYTLPGQ
jgi:hypothetical protein